MNILGINVYHPDVSAVLLRDGQLIAALEEERAAGLLSTREEALEFVRRSVSGA